MSNPTIRGLSDTNVSLVVFPPIISFSAKSLLTTAQISGAEGTALSLNPTSYAAQGSSQFLLHHAINVVCSTVLSTGPECCSVQMLVYIARHSLIPSVSGWEMGLETTQKRYSVVWKIESTCANCTAQRLPPASLLKLEVSRTGRGFLLSSILGSKSWSSVGLKKRGSVFCFGSVCLRVLANVCSLSWYSCFPAIFNLTMWGVPYPVLLKPLFGGDPIYMNGNLCLPFKCASGIFTTSALHFYSLLSLKKLMRKAILRL